MLINCFQERWSMFLLFNFQFHIYIYIYLYHILFPCFSSLSYCFIYAQELTSWSNDMSILFVASTLLASPWNQDCDVEEGNTFLDELPWLVEIQPSKSIKTVDRRSKWAKPKIARTFPWTFDTQHDANVLKRTKGPETRKSMPQTVSAATLPDIVPISKPPAIVAPTSMCPNNINKMKQDLRLLKAKRMQRSYSASTVLQPLRRTIAHTPTRRSKSAGTIRRKTAVQQKKLSPLLYRKQYPFRP